MGKKKTSTQTDESKKQQEEIIEAFRLFEQKGYTLNPHTNKLMKWIFDKMWLVFSAILLALVLGVIITFLRADDREALAARLGVKIKYPFYAYTWCQGYDQDLQKYVSFIYPKVNDPDCEVLALTPELETSPLLSPRDATSITIIWNTMADVLPISLSVLLSTLIFHSLTRKVPRIFLELAKAGRLKQPNSKMDSSAASNQNQAKTEKPARSQIMQALDVRPRQWNSFARDFENAVHSPWGHLLFILWLAIGFYMAYLFAVQFEVFKLHDFWQAFDYFMILGVIVLFLTYIAGYGIWTLAMIAAYIRKLSPVFDLDIEPGHGDGCGGLKPLGDICLEMALMIIFPVSVMAIFVFTGAYSASIPEFRLGILIAGVTAIIVAGLVFFGPLLDIHRDMLEKQKEFQNEAASRIGRVQQDLREALGAEKYDDAAAKGLESKLEKLNKAYPADLNYPTWPFTTKVILIFYSSQIVPITTVVTGLIEFFKQFAASPAK